MQHYFLDSLTNDIAKFNELDIHHILHVMRFKNNDQVIGVYNNQKYLIKLEVNKDNVSGKIIENIKTFNKSNDVTIIHGLPKLDKFELALQKSTELGVKNIVPFLSERSIIKLDDNDINKKLIRWEKIVKEASEQSERNSIPSVSKPIKSNNIKEYLSEINIVLDDTIARNSNNNLMKLLIENKNKSITCIIGPEGGFSKNEIDYFHSLGFISISLGSKILRSETAVFYILSCIDMVNNNEI